MAKKDGTTPPGRTGDVLLVHGLADDGQGYKVVRWRKNRVEAGVARKLRDGQPVTGDVVTLRPRPESPLLFDVDVQYSGRSDEGEGERNGPARAANKQYRKGWTQIWGRPNRRPSSAS